MLQSVLADERTDARGKPLPILLRRVCALRIELLVSRNQPGVRLSQPEHEPLLDPGAEMERSVQNRAGTGIPNPPEGFIEVLLRVGEVREDRHEEDGAVEPVLPRCGDRGEAGSRGRSARFDRLLQLVVVDRDRHCQVDRHGLAQFGQQRQIPPEQSALGEDAERRAALGQRGDDTRHQPVTPLRTLIRVGVGAQGYRMPPPARPCQLLSEHLGDVHLHDDLAVEVFPRVELEVPMGGAGEAIGTCMTAAPVGIDRPAERHGVARTRDVVERALGEHLVEGDSSELGGLHGAHEVGQFGQPRQGGRLLRCQFLPAPPHSVIRTHFRMSVKVLAPYSQLRQNRAGRMRHPENTSADTAGERICLSYEWSGSPPDRIGK